MANLILAQYRATQKTLGARNANSEMQENRPDMQAVDVSSSELAQNLLGGSTLAEAARNAGYSGKNLAQSGHQAFNAIRLSMPELLDEAGLNSRVLIEKYLVPLLSATTKKCLHHKGRFVYSRALPDYRTRVMALDMVFRMTGAYETSKSVTAPDAGIKVIVLDAPRPPRPSVTNASVLPSQTLDH